MEHAKTKISVCQNRNFRFALSDLHTSSLLLICRIITDIPWYRWSMFVFLPFRPRRRLTLIVRPRSPSSTASTRLDLSPPSLTSGFACPPCRSCRPSENRRGRIVPGGRFHVTDVQRASTCTENRPTAREDVGRGRVRLCIAIGEALGAVRAPYTPAGSETKPEALNAHTT